MTYKTIIFLALLQIGYFFSCQTPSESPQRRAWSNSFKNLCPNYGFLKESEIPVSSIYTTPAGSKFVSITYRSNSTSRMSTEDVLLSQLTKASEISTKDGYLSYTRRYFEICGNAVSPNKHNIKYLKLKEEEEKNSILFTSAPKDKILDIREDGTGFKDAWYNRFISPSKNNAFEGSEFDFETKKLEMERIRKFKYLITKVGDGTDLALSDYNFKQECFNFRYMNSGVPYQNIVMYTKDPKGYDGIGYIELEAYNHYEKNHCFPISKALAEQFKKDNQNKKYNWELLLEIKKVIDAPMDSKCNEYEYVYTKIACKQDNWEKIKIRRFEFAIVAFKATHIDSEEIIEGKTK